MLYVSFCDSDNDPTYAAADAAMIVESDGEGYNPCVGAGVRREAPLLPQSAAEIRTFADFMGWDVSVVNGKLTLTTYTPG